MQNNRFDTVTLDYGHASLAMVRDERTDTYEVRRIDRFPTGNYLHYQPLTGLTLENAREAFDGAVHKAKLFGTSVRGEIL